MSQGQPDCKHENFAVRANVGRITKEGEGTDVAAFLMELTVWCQECGLPFEFVGMPMVGLDFQHPMVNVDSTELRAPIKPKGVSMDRAKDLAGFHIRFREDSAEAQR